MSKLFFDDLIKFDKLEKKISELAHSPEEKQELWLLVDEALHHRIVSSILDELPPQHHDRFLYHLHQSPQSTKILDFLKENIQGNIEEIITRQADALMEDILENIKSVLSGEED